MTTSLKKSHWVLLITLAVSFYNLGVIWMMQMHVYRSFTIVVGTNEWPAFFAHHWQMVQLIVLPPAGLALVGAVLLVRFRPAGVPKLGTWVGLALQIGLFGLTGLIFAPLLVKVGTENNLELVHHLLHVHWIRVGLITAFAILLFWMTVRSFVHESSHSSQSTHSAETTQKDTNNDTETKGV